MKAGTDETKGVTKSTISVRVAVITENARFGGGPEVTVEHVFKNHVLRVCVTTVR